MSQHDTSPQLEIIALIARSVAEQPQDWLAESNWTVLAGPATQFNNPSLGMELIPTDTSIVVAHTAYVAKQTWLGMRLKPVRRIMRFSLSNPHAMAVSKHFQDVLKQARTQRENDDARAVLASIKGGAA